jgi:hypothetical protein
MKKELFKGLEEAKNNFNKWQGKARIHLDIEDMTAWCEVNEITSYSSTSIIRLVGKDDLYGRDDKFAYTKLVNLADAKLTRHKEGWSKSELDDDYRFAEYLK